MVSQKTPRPDGPAMKEPRTAPPRPAQAPRADSKRERARLLSLALIELIKQKVTELTGFGLVLAGGLLGAMLASYSPGDPSFNTARGSGAGGVVHNLIGTPGAYVADFVTQSVGFAGFLAVVAFTVWGIRLALLIGLTRPVWRGAMLVLAMLFAAVVLAALPPIPVPGLFREHPGGSLGLIVLERLDAAGPWTIPALLV